MADLREMLTAYVGEGKVMQLSTLDGDGSPYVSNLWFASAFDPDRLYFISRPARAHCDNIRLRARVAGAVLAIKLEGLGQAVRGVTFTGTAVELPTENINDQISVYVQRWPSAERAIDPRRLAAGETHHRLYEIRVSGWVLYDEENFRADPRQPVEAR
ncbi:MAG TPA: pyridoxamine 5'-phosphate oxidase family protein [Micromonosporaceae bacterium]|jgi:uncharacterized protein YhbP (UPF0306 family)